ncbi:MAG: hypothetical protein O2799_07755, partial [Planctomycetota bacterium]|nr:hypothetical protein [Planctomycetota bacterium]
MADKDLPSWIGWLAGWAEPGPRPWSGALWRGLAAVYAVQPVAFLTSPLGECDHCIAQFWQLFMALPGLVVGLLVNGRAATMGFKLVTGAVLVAVLAASIGAARRG